MIARSRIFPFVDVTVDSDKKAVSHTLDALDEEIIALKQLTSAISVRRNKLASVHKLPVELLARCFKWLSLIDPPDVTVQKPPGWHFQEVNWLHYRDLPRQRDIGWIKVRRHTSWSDFISGNAEIIETRTGYTCLPPLASSLHP